MKLAVDVVFLLVYKREGIGAKTIHVSVAKRYSEVAVNEKASKDCHWLSRYEVPIHVPVL